MTDAELELVARLLEEEAPGDRAIWSEPVLGSTGKGKERKPIHGRVAIVYRPAGVSSMHAEIVQSSGMFGYEVKVAYGEVERGRFVNALRDLGFHGTLENAARAAVRGMKAIEATLRLNGKAMRSVFDE